MHDCQNDLDMKYFNMKWMKIWHQWHHFLEIKYISILNTWHGVWYPAVFMKYKQNEPVSTSVFSQIKVEYVFCGKILPLIPANMPFMQQHTQLLRPNTYILMIFADQILAHLTDRFFLIDFWRLGLFIHVPKSY